jgi:hypothetical protein
MGRKTSKKKQGKPFLGFALMRAEAEMTRYEVRDEIVALKAERDKWQLLADCRQRLIEKQRAALQEIARRALEEK